ncbi:Aconitate hydratase [Pseudomonas chlororaphis subsp. aurantiaca]|nr:Aconitate hydratase [Pseudomonas chlororaphis subsp. aurantiaca]
MPESKGRTISANGLEYRVSDIRGIVTDLGGDYAKLPYSLRVLAENVLRGESDPEAGLRVICSRSKEFDIPFRPARVVLQDLLGTPALVDLAGLRDAVAEKGGNPRSVNPVTPTHLVVDHSLNVERWGTPEHWRTTRPSSANVTPNASSSWIGATRHSATFQSSRRAKASFTRSTSNA